MVQKTTSTSATGPKRRGRPPKFDRDTVVDSAIGAFWEGGLEATTLPDIEAATGIDRSTLYSSFGGKQGLYEMATTRYLDTAEDRLFAPLLEGTDDGLADIVGFLERLKTGLTSAEVPGCLVINNIARGDDPRPGERYRHLLQRGLVKALGRADQVTDDTIDTRAGLIGAAVIGVNLMSKAESDTATLATTVDGIIDQVRSWRDAPPPS